MLMIIVKNIFISVVLTIIVWSMGFFLAHYEMFMDIEFLKLQGMVMGAMIILLTASDLWREVSARRTHRKPKHMAIDKEWSDED